MAAVLFQAATRAHTLTEFDSINLARALRDFDVSKNQPHPPGYPLVVGSAHALHWVAGTLRAYLIFDLIASVAAVLTTYLLARELFGGRAGVVAGLLLCASPLFLYYADIVSVYPAEAALAPVVALLAYRVASGAPGWSSLLLLPTLAVTGGFRPSTLILLAPLCVGALLLGKPGWRRVALSAVIATAIVAAWLVPTITQAGGLHNYLHASDQTYGPAGSRTSVLHGASLSEAAHNIRVTVGGTVLAALPALLIVAICARRLRRPGRLELGVLVVWVVPYLAVYGLGHFGKPGYALGYLPALDVLAAGLVSGAAIATAVAGGLATVGVVGYLTLSGWGLPGAVARRSMAPFLPTARVVRAQDHETRELQVLAHTCVSPGCVIVSLPGSPRTWNHIASAMRKWYATESTVRDVTQLGGAEEPRYAALWVGTTVPTPVREHAHLVATAGYWRFYRSSPAATKTIVHALRG